MGFQKVPQGEPQNDNTCESQGKQSRFISISQVLTLRYVLFIDGFSAKMKHCVNLSSFQMFHGNKMVKHTCHAIWFLCLFFLIETK